MAFKRVQTDELRESLVASSAPQHSLQPLAAHTSSNKRSRPQGESEYDSDGAIDEDGDTAEMDFEAERRPIDPQVPNRPIKGLRKPKKTMLQTRSLPSHSFALGGGPKLTNDVIMNKVEEEDWSIGDFAAQSCSRPE
ncbi:hypothetical protein C0992_007366 [Termitomyces sp. T32_za158]|nr:hypothetical protein C0992_007366 [Termitomyces sp. T32_za158]